MHGSAGDGVAGDVGEAGAGALVEVPGAQQAGLAGRDLGVLGGLDLGQAAGVVPDADLVDDAREEAGRGARRGPGTADRGQRVGGGIGRLADGERAVEDAVEVEVPGRAVIGRGSVVPDVAAGSTVLPVTGWLRLGLPPLWASSKSATSLPLAGVDAEEVVDVGGGGLGLGPALGDQRDGGDAAGAGARADTGARALEPQLKGERGAAQVARGAQRRVLVRAVELEGRVAGAGRDEARDPGGGGVPRQRR